MTQLGRGVGSLKEQRQLFPVRQSSASSAPRRGRSSKAH